jgi:TatD DNase family protein
MHCFTGTLDQAQRSLEIGFLLSFAGNVTFPKAQNIRDAALLCPLDRMLIETDSPYLAPVPHRGKRNEPAYVAETAKYIAQLKSMNSEEVGRATTQNFYRFFKIDA